MTEQQITEKIEATINLAKQLGDTFKTLSIDESFKIALRACITDVINHSK